MRSNVINSVEIHFFFRRQSFYSYFRVFFFLFFRHPPRGRDLVNCDNCQSIYGERARFASSYRTSTIHTCTRGAIIVIIKIITITRDRGGAVCIYFFPWKGDEGKEQNSRSPLSIGRRQGSFVCGKRFQKYHIISYIIYCLASLFTYMYVCSLCFAIRYRVIVSFPEDAGTRIVGIPQSDNVPCLSDFARNRKRRL